MVADIGDKSTSKIRDDIGRYENPERRIKKDSGRKIESDSLESIVDKSSFVYETKKHF